MMESITKDITKEDARKIFENEIAEISRLDNEECNVFSILGCSKNELKHSYFLRWLLYSNAFFERFVRRCGIELKPEQIWEKRRINREETYKVDEVKGEDCVISRKYYEEGKYRHIDLNIIGETYTITIENKVLSGQHDDQCISYYNYMKNKNGKHYYVKDENGNNTDKEKEKFFIFLAKDADPQFDYLGGLIPKKMGESDKYSVVEKEDGLFEEEYINKGEKKLIYFNYRLILYSEIREYILNDPEFLKEYEEEYKNKSKEKNKGESTDKYFFAKEIVDQYGRLIDEFEKMNTEYSKLFDELVKDEEKEKAFYLLIDKCKELQKNEDDTDLGRFIDIAKQYYQAKKREYDEAFNDILKAIITSDVGIKTDYGRGSYARCLPVSVNVLGREDQFELLKNTLINKNTDGEDISRILSDFQDKEKEKNSLLEKIVENRKKLKEHKYKINLTEKVITKNGNVVKLDDLSEEDKKSYQAILDDNESVNKKNKEIKDYFKDIRKREKNNFIRKGKAKTPSGSNITFQTVDFRAPMSGVKDVTVAIVAGLSAPYSRNLCEELINEDVIYKKYQAEKEKEKPIELFELNYSITNGSGYKTNRETFKADLVNFREFFKKKENTEKYIGEVEFKTFISNEYMTFLANLYNNKIMEEDAFKSMVEMMFGYFSADDEYDEVEADGVSLTRENWTDIDIIGKLKKLEKKSENLFDADTINKYKLSMEKKLALLKLIKEKKKVSKEIKTGNSELVCTWALDVMVSIKDVGIDEKEKLSQEFYNSTIRLTELLGYDEYFKKQILITKK